MITSKSVANSASVRDRIAPRNHKIEAFTIVELLIVIVVIGVLAAIAIIVFNGLRARADTAALKSDTKNATTQLELDKADTDSYPDSIPLANGGKGLAKGADTNYQYTKSSDGYCLTATSSRKGVPAIMTSNANTTPTEGVCPGHTGPTYPDAGQGNSGGVTTLAGRANFIGTIDNVGGAARFNGPGGIAVDSSGTIYVADTYNHRIRKITPSGVVTTLAGSTQGSADGTGTAAQFYWPGGITVDASGTVYVADTYNDRIRKITPSGVVTTLAGSTFGYADGTGSSAQFKRPGDLAIDSSGTIYVSDGANNRIRKITPSGVVTTFVGSTQGFADGTGVAARLDWPGGMVFDKAGMLYVAESSLNNRIRKITPSGVVTTFVGTAQGSADGTGTAAQLYLPTALAIDSSNTIYVTERGNHRIRKITPNGVVTTLAGSTEGYADGVGTAAQFAAPRGIAISSSGVLYVADSQSNVIRKIE